MNLNFGQAIQALRDGKRVTRLSWQDFRVFVFRLAPCEIPEEVIPKMQSFPKSVREEFAKRGGNIRASSQLVFVTHDNTIHNWSVTNSDALANDWCILDIETPAPISTDDAKAEYNAGKK